MIRCLVVAVVLASGCDRLEQLAIKDPVANPTPIMTALVENASAQAAWEQAAGIDRNDAVIRKKAFQSTIESIEQQQSKAVQSAAVAQERVEEVAKQVEAIQNAPKSPPDLSPAMARIDDLEKRVQAVPVADLSPVEARIAELQKQFDEMAVLNSGLAREYDLKLQQLQKTEERRVAVSGASVAFPGRPDRLVYFHRADCIHCVTVETREFPKLRPQFVISGADTAHVQIVDWESLLGMEYRTALGAPDDPSFPLFLRVVDGKIRKASSGFMPADAIAGMAKEKPPDLRPSPAKAKPRA